MRKWNMRNWKAVKKEKVKKMPIDYAPKQEDIIKYLMIAAILFALAMVLNIAKKPEEKYSSLRLLQKSLPKEMAAGEKFNFGFIIQNHEGKEGLYEYLVLLDDNAIQTKKIIVGNLEEKLIYEGLKIDELGVHKIQVMVKLGEKQYDAYFHINIS